MGSSLPRARVTLAGGPSRKPQWPFRLVVHSPTGSPVPSALRASERGAKSELMILVQDRLCVRD